MHFLVSCDLRLQLKWPVKHGRFLKAVIGFLEIFVRKPSLPGVFSNKDGSLRIRHFERRLTYFRPIAAKLPLSQFKVDIISFPLITKIE